MKQLQVAVSAIVCVLATVAFAGSPMFGTLSGPADLFDPTSYVENPAMTELTIDQAAMGYQMLHTGVLEDGSLSSGFLTLSSRRNFGGIGLGMNFVNTPGWSEKQFRLAYGRRIWNGISLGLRAGIYQHGFDKGDFNIADTNDPMLQGALSKTVPTLGLGAFYSAPFSPFSLGLVVDDPHQPSTSFDGSDADAKRAMTINAGVGFEQDIYQGSLSYAHNSIESRFSMTGRAFLVGDNALFARVSSIDWSLGARFAVHSALWVDYGFSLPLSDLASETSGTHSIVVCYRPFDRPEAPPEYSHRSLLHDTYTVRPPVDSEIIKPTAEPLAIPTLESHADLYYVSSSDDKTEILTKRLSRRLGEGVAMADLRHRPYWQVGLMDTTWSDRVVYSLAENVSSVNPRDGLPGGNYSEDYRARMEQMGAELDPYADGQVIIVADSTQLARAKFLKEQILGVKGDDQQQQLSVDHAVGIKQISVMEDSLLHAKLFQTVGSDSIPVMEEITLYDPEFIEFYVNFLGEQQSIQSWELNLSDSDDELVWTRSGFGSPPDTLSWDLRDLSDEVVDVDNYYFAFSWKKSNGAQYTLPAQEIQVHKFLMHKTLDFSKGAPGAEEMKDATPVLILDPGREGEVLTPTGNISIGEAEKNNEPQQ